MNDKEIHEKFPILRNVQQSGTDNGFCLIKRLITYKTVMRNRQYRTDPIFVRLIIRENAYLKVD